jgi:signal transduction histidine kinase
MSKGTLLFTVDSALLRELGERLVGRPYIALAELTKNGYDADATNIKITLDLKGDRIIVEDNGHGMTFNEFRDFWMRIGSTHKREQRVSRKLKRVMTGSKGVGRLAVQFLAQELEIHTSSSENPGSLLKAQVNWSDAVRAENLTSAEVHYELVETEESTPGTKLILNKLNNIWNEEEIIGLARKLWWLQPPFRGIISSTDPKKTFSVEFASHAHLVDLFNNQMNAILDIWYARIVGRNKKGRVSMTVEWAGEEPITHEFRLKGCQLINGDFEIRIYHLWDRQPRGIRVGEAREYLNEFGGVNVYDGGFRLPYYGDKQNDWLSIEQDHSHRKSVSDLLPEEVRKGIDRGLQFLPTLSRFIGVVNVDTSDEPDLEIVVTRDRFRHNYAYDHLRSIVRYAIDFYALWEKKRALRRDEAKKETLKRKAQYVQEVLDTYQEEIPKQTFKSLQRDLFEVIGNTESDAEKTTTQIALWGSLATAGITSLAYQHETRRQFRAIENIVDDITKLLRRIKSENLRKNLKALQIDLSSWVSRARQTNALFTHLSDPENLDVRERFNAKQIAEDVWSQVEILAPKVKFNTNGIDNNLLLPKASFAEWSTIFQNVFINAFNAMFHLKRRIIDVSSTSQGQKHEILVQDSGYGIDLRRAKEFFEPLKRGSDLPPTMKELGYGGTGLGLSIVRLVARNIGCEVSFKKPSKGFKTAFSIKWRV